MKCAVLFTKLKAYKLKIVKVNQYIMIIYANDRLNEQTVYLAKIINTSIILDKTNNKI